MQINIARKGQLFLLLSFAALIGVGTVILLFPGILKEGTLPFIDALFMACSAVCLNGLTTVPLTEFSFAGQLVLLVLIQFGTLGIMTLNRDLVRLAPSICAASSISSGTACKPAIYMIII